MFEELVPWISPLIKKHVRLRGHTGIMDPEVTLSMVHPVAIPYCTEHDIEMRKPYEITSSMVHPIAIPYCTEHDIEMRKLYEITSSTVHPVAIPYCTEHNTEMRKLYEITSSTVHCCHTVLYRTRYRDEKTL